jgi:hypothetical protein
MAWTITLSNGSSLGTVAYYALDTSLTCLTLIGKIPAAWARR